MTPPTTPLTDDVREWIRYARWLDTRQGFMQTYARKLADIWHTTRVKKGLKSAAYQATEVWYDHVLQSGPKYPDVENFRDNFSKHCRNPSAKQ